MADTTKVRAGFTGSTHSGDAAGAVREVELKAPNSEDAKTWDGWGTALKPAHEPICVARKPFTGTVAGNVLEHGTGALNIDACRVDWDAESLANDTNRRKTPVNDITGGSLHAGGGIRGGYMHNAESPSGRWPANVIMDEEAGNGAEWARFYYCPKASKADRGEGNNHPTVKPCDLMRYLVRLITPPGGLVLDPFMGSGSTGKAAALEGFRFVGIDLSAEYVEISRDRIDGATAGRLDFAA
jgi:site-specific DNA-methyltransferase (adenine-specific)